MKYNYEIVFGTGSACMVERTGSRTRNPAAVRLRHKRTPYVIGSLTSGERNLIKQVASSKKPWAKYADDRSLLTGSESNPKIAKGLKSGIATTVLHLAPSVQSGKDVCVFATPGCAAACLNTAGRGGIVKKGGAGIPRFRNLAKKLYRPSNSIQNSRVLKTMFFYEDRPAFMTRLANEISDFTRWARKHDLYPAARLNGTSDIQWENIPVTFGGRRYANIMQAFPGVQFYDYTKNPFRLKDRRNFPPNYHLTFSVADLTRKNRDHPEIALANGMNLAVVFNVKKSQSLPMTWGGIPVIDADLHDLRFLDNIENGIRGPLIAGLHAKGKAIGEKSGFARNVGGKEDEFFTGAIAFEPSIEPIFEMRA